MMRSLETKKRGHWPRFVLLKKKLPADGYAALQIERENRFCR